MRVANALVGNEATAAGLEATLGKVRLRFDDTRVVAWCGGLFAVTLDNEPLPAGHPVRVEKGEELVMIAPKPGARAWLAISGGIAVPPILGSRSTDLRGNFGGVKGRVLRDGDVLSLGTTSLLSNLTIELLRDRRIATWSAPTPWTQLTGRDRFLRVIRGSEWPRFTPEAHRSFGSRPFNVTLESDRMGVRLEGPDLPRHDVSDLLSEAVAPGTLQVPPNGRPILLLGDCQTIGGYPKIAHVITVDLPIAAQLWAGDLVRFFEISLEDAQTLLGQREMDFARFRVGIKMRLE
jgi:antagonist of KipI